MGRNRVLSFMSQFSAGSNSKAPSPSSSPPSDSPLSNPQGEGKRAFISHQRAASVPSRPLTPPSHLDYGSPVNGSPTAPSPHRHKRSNSRPISIQTYPTMDVTEDTIPELQPIFSFLNSHQNKLYHEGYFLKLDDQNTQGQPNADRTWTECFAQLVGTVLSLWDAAELDAAGEEGEVLPKFLNLTDASIKMIEALPTRSADEQPLQNILSISTAGRNRYLLHFNSHHALVQWTAGIRLAIFEHNTLQEAYTGALIAAKGKSLNNINVIMERARFPTQEWVRVRFGAGVPWRRCWCVISPPDEKEYAKLQKELKKRSPYDRSHVPVLKGDIKFYDAKVEGKKLKKAQPIATITDAYSAYAIYPQAKSLIDASTLIKVEGSVTIHSDPPSAAEGFVFIMPETRPMVSGFEMMLRFVFPTWDTFGLYGRPGKLVASVLDPRSLMFAMPKHKRYGYLELLDVTTLINENGSTTWNEQEWRRRLKESTGTRMNAIDDGTRSPHSRSDSRSSARVGFGADLARPKVGFTEDSPTRGSRSQSVTASDRPMAGFDAHNRHQPSPGPFGHVRNTSESSMPSHTPSPAMGANPYGSPDRGQAAHRGVLRDRVGGGGDPSSSDEERGNNDSPPQFGAMRNLNTPEPVSRPPEFGHASQKRPVSVAYHTPEMRRANSRLSSTTLAQLAKAGGLNVAEDQNAEHGSRARGMEGGAIPGPSVHSHNANSMGTFANDNRSHEALRSPGQNRPPNNMPPPLVIPNQRSESPAPRSPYGQPGRFNDGQQRPHTADGPRPNYGPGGPAGGPPRSPLAPSRSQQGLPGSPGPGAQGRGRPPPNMRPPPGQGPGPYGTHLGPPGPGQRKPLPERSTSLDKHTSVTADHIIEHYANNHDRWQPTTNHGPEGRRPDMPHMHEEPGFIDQADRPRAGVLKTVGGGNEPPMHQGGYDVPDVNFGPTVNYGAPAPRSRGPMPPGPSHPAHAGPQGGPGGPGAPFAQPQRPYSPGPQRSFSPGPQRSYSPAPQRPYSPGPPRPSTAGAGGRNSPAPQHGAGRSVPWSAAHASPGPGPGPHNGPYGAGRGGPNPHAGPMSPMGPPGSAGPSGQGSSFSRPLQSGTMSPQPTDPRYLPPQGQYSNSSQPPPGQRNVHPQYQGQAF